MKKFTHLFVQSSSLKRLVFQHNPEAQPEGQKTSKPKTGVDYYQEERQRFLNQLQRHAEGKVDYPGKGKNPEADKAHQERATEFIGKVQTEAQDLSDKKDNLEAGMLKKNQDALRALQAKFGEMRVAKSEGPTVSPEVQKKLDNYKVALAAFRRELEDSSKGQFAGSAYDKLWRSKGTRLAKRHDKVTTEDVTSAVSDSAVVKPSEASIAKSDSIIKERATQFLPRLNELEDAKTVTAESVDKNMADLRKIIDEYRSILYSDAYSSGSVEGSTKEAPAKKKTKKEEEEEKKREEEEKKKKEEEEKKREEEEKKKKEEEEKKRQEEEEEKKKKDDEEKRKSRSRGLVVKDKSEKTPENFLDRKNKMSEKLWRDMNEINQDFAWANREGFKVNDPAGVMEHTKSLDVKLISAKNHDDLDALEAALYDITGEQLDHRLRVVEQLAPQQQQRNKAEAQKIQAIFRSSRFGDLSVVGERNVMSINQDLNRIIEEKNIDPKSPSERDKVYHDARLISKIKYDINKYLEKNK